MQPSDVSDLRRGMALSQPEFGRLLGVHPMTVSKWERKGGGSQPNEYQQALMGAFRKGLEDEQTRQMVKGVLIGAGIAAALLLLLKASEGR